MIVQCPNCKAKYNLPDQKVGPDGAKLRCGKCKHVFHAGKTAAKAVPPPPPPPPPPAPDDDQDIFAGMDEDLFGDAAAQTGASQAKPAAQTPSIEDDGDFEPPSDFDYPDFDDHGADAGSDSDFGAPAGASRVYNEPDSGPSSDASSESGDEPDPFAGTVSTSDEPVKPGFSLDDVADIDISGKRRPMSKEKKKRVIILASVFLFLLLGTGAALYFLDLIPGMGKPAPEETQPAAPAEEPAAPAQTETPAEKSQAQPEEPKKEGAVSPEESAKVKNIVLQNVRQYFVTNDKAGQLCVIEGKAVNKFKTPKEMIKLKANLFDDKGAVIAEQTALCGNTVSLFQLQVMTKAELETALSSQVGVLTNNTNIQPDGETPFMFVFFSVPENLAEFVVKVVDAKDPPAQ